MANKTSINTIWNSEWLFDEKLRNAIKEDCKEDYQEDFDITDDYIDEIIYSYLEDEIMNLDVRVNGIILAYADLGLWNGRVKGIKDFGNKISNILVTNGDYVHWYVDRYNVHATINHHDGTNYILYRVVKDKETADRIAYNILYNDKGMDYFKRNTKSLKPYVANVYGF